MTNKEIIKGNRLIAEFMVYSVIECSVPTWKIYHKDGACAFTDKTEGKTAEMLIDEQWEIMGGLEYHKSWDMLIPVVQKVTSLKHPVSLYFSHIQNCTAIYALKSEYAITRESSTMEEPIELCWKALVYFIEQHNRKEKK